MIGSVSCEATSFLQKENVVSYFEFCYNRLPDSSIIQPAFVQTRSNKRAIKKYFNHYYAGDPMYYTPPQFYPTNLQDSCY